MKRRLTYALLISILMTNVAYTPKSYAENLRHVNIDPIHTINFNEMVMITGSTNLDRLIVQVKRSNGSLVYFDIIEANQGTFMNVFKMPAIEKTGIYKVEVGYESELSITEFKYISETQRPEPPNLPEYPSPPERPNLPEPSDEEVITENIKPNIEDVSISATDLRSSQEHNMTIQATQDFIEECTSIYNNRPIKTVEFFIEDEADEDLGSKMRLGLKINDDELRVEGKIPPIELTLVHEPNQNINPEYFAIRYVDKDIRIPRTQYDNQSLSFIVEELGNYQVSYHEEKFTDLASVPMAAKYINSLVAQGIIKGRTETSFMPHEKITRAEYIVLLMRILNLDKVSIESFEDITPNSYYYDAVGTAKALGIVEGDGKNYFRPHAIILKQEMILMMARALKQEERLKDEEKVELLNQLERIETEITRAELTPFLYELYKKYEQLEHHAFTISIIPKRG